MSATTSAPVRNFASPTPSALLAPLSNGIYRRLWIAALMSNFGVWIQSVAAAWLMTSIAPTVDFVAWVQAATSLPPLFFTVFGGVLADRFDQRLVFLCAQLIVLIVALSLSVLDQFSLMTPWLLLGLTFALDSGSALRYPAYQTTIYDLLPREQIASALVLSSIGWNIARAAGPGLGGLIIATLGVQAAFAVNALCNVYIIVVLFRWRRQKAIAKAPPQCSIWAAVADGFVHVHANPIIRAAMVRCFVLTLFSAALWSLLPLVAKNLVGGGASVYGLMLGALGIGALIGAGCIGWMRDNLGYRRLFAISSICLALTTLAMATVSAVVPLLIVLAVGGLGWMISMSTFNLVVQMAAAETHRGRAISVYYIALFGGLALGSWAFGHIAEMVSVRTGLIVATAGLAASLVLYRAGSSAPHPFSERAEVAPAE